jgi:hypothetical protein
MILNTVEFWFEISYNGFLLIWGINPSWWKITTIVTPLIPC